MFGIFKLIEENERLEQLENKLKSARILGVNECVRCGFCCNRRTCVPTPEELKNTAKFLNISTKKLIEKYYAIDKLEETYILKPVGVNIKDLAGKFIPSYRTWNEGRCVFLEGNGITLCKIYPVRPESAKISKCWVKLEKEEVEKMSKRLIEAWGPNKIKTEFNIDVSNLDEYEDDYDYEDD